MFSIVFLVLPVSAHAQYESDYGYESDPTGYESDTGYGVGYVSDMSGNYGYASDLTDYGYVSDPTGYGYVSDPSGYGYESDPNAYGYVSDPTGYGYVSDPTTYNTYTNSYSSSYPLGTYSPSPLSNDYCYGCIGPTNAAYGMGGTQRYGNSGYGNGWGVTYSNYGYMPVYGRGGTQYASAAYPMYQMPTNYYMQPQSQYNYMLSWGNVSYGPVLYSKSIGTSVPLYGTYPSCVIYFLPGDNDYMRGLKWSGINISQAMLTGYGQVTGEGFMQVPYNGQAYVLTVWNSKGEMTTCSTR